MSLELVSFIVISNGFYISFYWICGCHGVGESGLGAGNLFRFFVFENYIIKLPTVVDKCTGTKIINLAMVACFIKYLDVRKRIFFQNMLRSVCSDISQIRGCAFSPTFFVLEFNYLFLKMVCLSVQKNSMTYYTVIFVEMHAISTSKLFFTLNRTNWLFGPLDAEPKMGLFCVSVLWGSKCWRQWS